MLLNEIGDNLELENSLCRVSYFFLNLRIVSEHKGVLLCICSSGELASQGAPHRVAALLLWNKTTPSCLKCAFIYYLPTETSFSVKN